MTMASRAQPRLWRDTMRAGAMRSGAMLGAAALLTFIDCMKELPATLLLRPLNVETLATAVFGEASRGTYEDGAVAALAIVLLGLLPVALLGVRRRGPRWVSPRAV